MLPPPPPRKTRRRAAHLTSLPTFEQPVAGKRSLRLSNPARVLIVDSSSESREILSTLLHRQGAETLEATEPASAATILQQQKPDLVVIDADRAEAFSQEQTLDFGRSAIRSDTPIVVLGTARKLLSPLSAGQFVAKPYHYGPLIRRIESLLGNRTTADSLVEQR